MAKMTTFLLLTHALFAFAGNSVLNRIALQGDHIDAQSFTLIRLISGTVALQLLMVLQTGRGRLSPISFKRDYKGAIALFLYALCFSVAYLSLDTGTGALILFGVVQVLLLVLNYYQGNRLTKMEWLGVVLAISGLLILLLPGAAAPDVLGFVLMCAAGIAWGLYTWWGRGSRKALEDTTDNFLNTLPLCLVLLVCVSLWDYKNNSFSLMYSGYGIWLAVTSGAVTSGIGYAIWYAVLPRLSVVQSALSQLLVPVIAVAAGIVFLGEQVTVLFIISSALIFSGILLIQLAKR